MTDLGDELYGLPPNEFVAARTALVARLRADGKRELATAVKARRRPTAAGGELNRILRLAPAAVDDLLEAANRLRAANQQLLEGESQDLESQDLESLKLEHRAQAERLAARAQRDGPKLQAALETASLDPAMHQDLRSAVFVDLPAPAQGFDLLTPVSDNPGAARPITRPPRSKGTGPRAGSQPEPKSQPKPKSQPEPKSQPGPSSSRAAKQREEQAAARDRAARRRAAAEQRVAKARQRCSELEDRLEAARAHLEACEAQVEAAAVAQARAEGGDPTTPA